MFTTRPATVAMAAMLAMAASPAAAERTAIPDAVRDMINAALDSGDAGKIAAVLGVARDTNPGAAEEIDALHQAFRDRVAERAAAADAAKEARIRAAGVFDEWSGQGEIGAHRSTGNSSSTGLTAGLKLVRTGIDWTHRMAAQANYQRSGGRTTREQFLIAYEPNARISDDWFAYGLMQYERDRIQGFTSRMSTSGGLGHRVVDNDRVTLTVKGGPAWRRTRLVGGDVEYTLAELASFDLGWRLSPRLRATQVATAYFDADNTNLKTATGLEAKFDDSLSARLSYTLDHNTYPPPGAERTDTLTRFTLIYGF